MFCDACSCDTRTFISFSAFITWFVVHIILSQLLSNQLLRAVAHADSIDL